MITATIIICLTVILIVAIICYKEYKLNNNCSFVTIECDLKSLSRKLELNNSILESLAESISYPPKEGKNKKETCDNSHCEKVNESKKKRWNYCDNEL